MGFPFGKKPPAKKPAKKAPASLGGLKAAATQTLGGKLMGPEGC